MIKRALGTARHRLRRGVVAPRPDAV